MFKNKTNINKNRQAIIRLNQVLSTNNQSFDLFFEENKSVEFVIRDRNSGTKMIIATLGDISECNYYQLNLVLMQVGSNLRFSENIRNVINRAFISLLNNNDKYYDLESNYNQFEIKTTINGKDYYGIDNYTKQINRNKILSAIDDKNINLIRYFTKNKKNYEGVQLVNRDLLKCLVNNSNTQYRMLPDLDYASVHALWNDKAAWSSNTMKVVHEFNGEVNNVKYYAKIRFNNNNLEVDMHRSFNKKALFGLNTVSNLTCANTI